MINLQIVIIYLIFQIRFIPMNLDDQIQYLWRYCVCRQIHSIKIYAFRKCMKGNVQNYLVILDSATENLSWSTIQFITLQTLYVYSNSNISQLHFIYIIFNYSFKWSFRYPIIPSSVNRIHTLSNCAIMIAFRKHRHVEIVVTYIAHIVRVSIILLC